MSATRLKLPRLVEDVFALGQKHAQCTLDNTYFDVETKKAISFSLESDLVFSPEYRLAGSIEDVIEDYLSSYHLPAPSFYLDKDTPEDDKTLIEALKGAVGELVEFDPESHGEELKLKFVKTTKSGVKLRAPRFNKLYTMDKECLKNLNVKLGLIKSPTKPVTRIKVAVEPAPTKRTTRTIVRNKVSGTTVKPSKTPVCDTSDVCETVEEPVEEVVERVTEPVEEVVEETVEKVEEIPESVEEEVFEEAPEIVEEPVEEVVPVAPRRTRRVIRKPEPVTVEEPVEDEVPEGVPESVEEPVEDEVLEEPVVETPVRSRMSRRTPIRHTPRVL